MQHPAIPSPEELAERGVYVPPCLDELGYYYIVAVDSRHRKIESRRVFNPDDLDSVAEALWRILDEKDPIVHHPQRAA